MNEYEVGDDMQSLRKDLGLADDSPATEVMTVLWAKLNGSVSSAIPADVERAARALCKHFGTDPDRTFQRLDATGNEMTAQPAWRDQVAIVEIVLEALKQSS